MPLTFQVPQLPSFGELVPSQNKETVDLLGIVIEKFEPRTIGSPPRNYKVHEFALINHEKKPLILSLWNNIALSEGRVIMNARDAMPVIFATKLTVSIHYGLSVGSTSLTTIVVDPPMPNVQKLKTWRANNQQFIRSALDDVHETMKNRQSVMLPTKKLHSIAEVIKINDMDKFMLNVKIQISEPGQKNFYVACENCYTSYASDCYWEIDCQSCNKRVLTKPREKITAKIIDETGTLQVTAFGLDAVKIMNMNAVMAMEMYNAGNVPSIEKMTSDIESKTFLVKLKKTSREKHDAATHIQYTILSLVENKERTTQEDEHFTTNIEEEPAMVLRLDKPHIAKRLFSQESSSGSTSSSSSKKMKGLLIEEDYDQEITEDSTTLGEPN